MSKVSRMLLFAQVPAFLVWFALAIVAYDALPERIPVHFNGAGVADGFAERSWWSWFLLPFFAFLSSMSVLTLGRWTVSRPQYWNVPHKAKILALSPEQRQPLADMVELALVATSAMVVVLLAVLHYETWRVATGNGTGLSGTAQIAIYVLIGGMIPLLLVWLLAFNKRVRRITA